MKFTFTGRNISLTESLKDKASAKLGRLAKLLPENAEITVAFSVVKQDQTVEVTIPLNKRILRAEVTTEDMYASIDEIVDKLEKQMVKYKSRLRNKSKKDVKFQNELSQFLDNVEETDSQYPVIEKTKRFALKPMDAEEAVMELELLGHSFYVFLNSTTEEVNVVYKRKDGTFGHIEPEF